MSNISIIVYFLLLCVIIVIYFHFYCLFTFIYTYVYFYISSSGGRFHEPPPRVPHSTDTKAHVHYIKSQDSFFNLQFSKSKIDPNIILTSHIGL
jgi:hypothetical protein